MRGDGSVWWRKMERPRGAAWSSLFSRPAKASPSPRRFEDERYPIDDLVFDLANIRGGPRFAGEDAPMGGRLGILCQRVYDRADHPGYLEMGTPTQYGSGASEVIREVAISNPAARYKLTTDSLRAGDIERALMEWRSLLRHIVHAPELDWDRWRELESGRATFRREHDFTCAARFSAAAGRATATCWLIIRVYAFPRAASAWSRSGERVFPAARFSTNEIFRRHLFQARARQTSFRRA